MEAGVQGQGEGKGEVPADITLHRIGLIGRFSKEDKSNGKKKGPTCQEIEAAGTDP